MRWPSPPVPYSTVRHKYSNKLNRRALSSFLLLSFFFLYSIRSALCYYSSISYEKEGIIRARLSCGGLGSRKLVTLGLLTPYGKRSTGARDLKPTDTRHIQDISEHQQCDNVQCLNCAVVLSVFVWETLLYCSLTHNYHIHIVTANNMCSPYSLKLWAISPRVGFIQV